MAQRSNVRPHSRKLTDADARHLLADGLLRTCHQHGPSRVALETGCDEKTIRRARDEESTLGLACTWNLLDIDQHALDALAAAKGVMLVPLIADAPDVVVAAGAAIHRIGQARDPNGPGKHKETDAELIGMEAEADAMLAAALELRSRIVAAKLRRAAA
jgi:hypothetical protein